MSRAASSVALPVLAAAAVFLVVGYSAGTRVARSGDPAAMIRAGEQFAAPELLPSDAVIEPATGYDGQFFFYLAQDPLLTGRAASWDEETSPHVDWPGYRYQRILLPALGWLTSWGNPDVLEWTLPLINVLAVLGTGFLLARFLSLRGRSPWLSLVFMVSLGMLAGVTNDLADPLAAALFVAGVLWWLEGRAAPAVIALAACLLARELYVLPVATIALLELLRAPRRGLPWLVPLAVLGAWQIGLRLILAAPVTPDAAERPSIVPLLGAVRKAREVIRLDWLGAAHWELLFVALLLGISLYLGGRGLLAVVACGRARRLPSREALLPVVAFAAVATIPFLTVALWRYIPSYARYAAPAAGLLVLLDGIRRDLAVRLMMAALIVLTLTNPVVALLPISHAPAVQAPNQRGDM